MKLLLLILTTASFSLHGMDDVPKQMALLDLNDGEKPTASVIPLDEKFRVNLRIGSRCKADGVEALNVLDEQEKCGNGNWVATPLAERVQPNIPVYANVPHVSKFLRALLAIQQEKRVQGKELPDDREDDYEDFEEPSHRKIFLEVFSAFPYVEKVEEPADKLVYLQFLNSYPFGKKVKTSHYRDSTDHFTVSVTQSIENNDSAHHHVVTWTPITKIAEKAVDATECKKGEKND